MNQGSGLNLRSSVWGEIGEALKNSGQNRFQPTNLESSEEHTFVRRPLSRIACWLTPCSEVSKAHSCGKGLKPCRSYFHKYLYSFGPAALWINQCQATTWICMGRGGNPPGTAGLSGCLCGIQQGVKHSQKNSCPQNISSQLQLGWASGPAQHTLSVKIPHKSVHTPLGFLGRTPSQASEEFIPKKTNFWTWQERKCLLAKCPFGRTGTSWGFQEVGLFSSQAGMCWAHLPHQNQWTSQAVYPKFSSAVKSHVHKAQFGNSLTKH